MSDYLDNLAKTSSTNYSVQPGGSIHESFPAQASGGQSEHSDSEGKPFSTRASDSPSEDQTPVADRAYKTSGGEAVNRSAKGDKY